MPGFKSNRVPSRRASSAILAAATLVATTLVLASCAQPTGYYPAKSDVKPQANVARAHTLPIHGIDVSRWQGGIDWTSVRAAGTQFAFLKATEGGDRVDPRFLENWDGAARAGVPRGAYHFMYWCRPPTSRRPGSAAMCRTIRLRFRPSSISNGMGIRPPVPEGAARDGS